MIFVGTSHEGKCLEVITRLDEYGDQGKYNARMVIKHFGEAKNFYDHKLTKFEELSDLELQPEGSGSLNNSSTSTNIPQSGEKSSDNLEFRKKRLHRQINPIIRDGRVRDEYADLLENKEYTPEKIADWQEKAFEWILKRGGIVQAAEDFLADKAPSDGHIAELARRFILNSDVAAEGLSIEERTKLYDDRVIRLFKKYKV